MSAPSSLRRYDAMLIPIERKRMRSIIRHVCKFYRADVSAVMSYSRQAGLIWPRHVAMAIAAANGFSSTTIASALNRERSVVSYAHKQVLNQCSVDKEVDREVRKLAKEIKEKILKK